MNHICFQMLSIMPCYAVSCCAVLCYAVPGNEHKPVHVVYVNCHCRCLTIKRFQQLAARGALPCCFCFATPSGRVPWSDTSYCSICMHVLLLKLMSTCFPSIIHHVSHTHNLYQKCCTSWPLSASLRPSELRTNRNYTCLSKHRQARAQAQSSSVEGHRYLHLARMTLHVSVSMRGCLHQFCWTNQVPHHHHNQLCGGEFEAAACPPQIKLLS